MWVTVYTSRLEGSDALIDATTALAAEFGITGLKADIDEIGSRWWRAKQRAKKAIDSELAQKAQHGIETRLLGLPEAQMTETLARATRELADAIKDQDYACSRAGQIMIIKHPYNGQSLVLTRTLSVAEMTVLDRFPEIEKHPEQVLGALATALAMDPEGLTIDKILPPGTM